MIHLFLSLFFFFCFITRFGWCINDAANPKGLPKNKKLLFQKYFITLLLMLLLVSIIKELSHLWITFLVNGSTLIIIANAMSFMTKLFLY